MYKHLTIQKHMNPTILQDNGPLMIAVGITWGTIIVSEKTTHIGHHRHQCLHVVH